MLVTVVLLVGCAPPSSHHTPPVSTSATANSPSTARSPLADRSIYWSSGSLLMALRASDGARRWRVGDWSGPLPGGLTYLHAGPNAPTFADGMLYTNVLAPSLEVNAFVASDGVLRWHTPLEGCFNNGYVAQSPLVVGGMVYIAAEGHDCATIGRVYALRADSGTIAWQVPLDRVLDPAHAFFDGTLFLSSVTNPATDPRAYLTALRASNGARLWRQPLDMYFGSATSVGDGLVFLGGDLTTGNGGVEARRASDGAIQWRFPMGRYDQPEPLLIGETVYFSGDDGTFYALRASNGAIQWRFASGERAVGPPTVAGDLVYVGAGTTLFGLSAQTGAIMRAYHPFDTQNFSSEIIFSYSAPVISDGAIFVAVSAHPCGAHCPQYPLETTLFALDADSGANLWAHKEFPGLPFALTLGP